MRRSYASKFNMETIALKTYMPGSGLRSYIWRVEVPFAVAMTLFCALEKLSNRLWDALVRAKDFAVRQATGLRLCSIFLHE